MPRSKQKNHEHIIPDGKVWLRAVFHDLKLPGKKNPPRRVLCRKYPERNPKDVLALYRHFENKVRDELGIKERTGGARMDSQCME